MSWQVNPRLLGSEYMQRCSLSTCKAACCLYGVWVDLFEIEKIMLHSALIQSFLSEDRREPAHWFTSEMQSDDHTPSKKVRHTDLRRDPDHYGGTSCVFLCRDYKCALQVASIASGQHPWTLKPFYCILHPLDLDSQGRITLDETHLLLEEKASCLVPAPHPIPLAITFEPELRYFLGDEGYEDLLNQVNNSSS